MAGLSFRAPSRKTRIETFLNYGHGSLHILLSERHPEKQGLKLLKKDKDLRLLSSFRAPSRKTRIETIGHEAAPGGDEAFRAPSRKTRIET